jgi:hypothetical protein
VLVAGWKPDLARRCAANAVRRWASPPVLIVWFIQIRSTGRAIGHRSRHRGTIIAVVVMVNLHAYRPWWRRKS